jgi:hypothetical protein
MLARGSFGAEARRLLAAHPEDPDSLRRLAFLCKRERLLEGASEAFRTLVEKTGCAGPRGLFAFVEACTELSKLFEHGFRNYAEGKRYAELALGRLERAALLFPAACDGGDRGRLARETDALRKRLGRLNRRLGTRVKTETRR